MTTIAWDGKSLAADKLMSQQGLRGVVTKIQRGADGSLIGISGQFSTGLHAAQWVANGADPALMPKTQDTDEWVGIIQIKPDGTIWKYERGPVPMKIEDCIFAVGSGRDFALAAMYLGKSAIEAVKVAARFDVYTGMGVDVLNLVAE